VSLMLAKTGLIAAGVLGWVAEGARLPKACSPLEPHCAMRTPFESRDAFVCSALMRSLLHEPMEQ
jgi:hypothetical protein